MDSNLLFIVVVLMFGIILVGWLTGRRLPESGRKRYYRQFGAVALVVYCVYILGSAPFIPSTSYVSSKEYEYPKDLSTTEIVVKQTQLQYRRIENLEDEVKELRSDLSSLNQHYRLLMQGSLTVMLMFVFQSAFSNRKENDSN